MDGKSGRDPVDLTDYITMTAIGELVH
jgi:hypothetical protein